MKDHTGDERTFCMGNRAWYKRTGVPDNTEIALRATDGGASGTIDISWHEIGGNNVPRLEVYGDSWSALATMPDLIAALAEHDDQNITQDELAAILLNLGFRDATVYTSPHAEDEAEQARLIAELCAAETRAAEIRAKLKALKGGAQ